MQGRGTPPKLILNRHCQVCEFRRRCHAEATAKDDISLLRGVSEKEVRKYARRGIFTVTQLSYTYRPQRRRGGVKHDHTLKALAIRKNLRHKTGPTEAA